MPRYLRIFSWPNAPAWGAIAALAYAGGQVAWGGTAHAQATNTGANPSQIERRIDEAAPAPQPKLEDGPDLPALVPEEGETDARFILSAVAFVGVETLTAEELAATYEEYLGRTISTADAAEIANRITKVYRDAGYVLSRAFVPPQLVETGVLTVQVAEGQVVEVELTGADRLGTDLSAYTAAIEREAPLTLGTLERNILLIGDISGINVERSNLEEVEEGSGRFRLTLALDYDAQDATVYADNRGTPAVGRLQTWVSGGTNSLFGLGERIQVGVFTVPNQPEELLYKEVSYQQPLGSAGTEAHLSASHSAIDAGNDLGLLDTHSTSTRFALRMSHPVVRSRTENLWINGFLEYRNAQEYQSGAENFDDRLRVARLRFNYNRSGETFFSSALLRLSQGLDVLGASKERSGPLSRTDGDPKFFKVSAEASHAHTLYGGLSAQVSAIGQKSANGLLAAEEFALGGSRFGRAYDFAEITGEDGVAGALELRYTFDDVGDFFEFLQVYSFFDMGAV